jgi:hypothetical protein
MIIIKMNLMSKSQMKFFNLARFNLLTCYNIYLLLIYNNTKYNIIILYSIKILANLKTIYNNYFYIEEN